MQNEESRYFGARIVFSVIILVVVAVYASKYKPVPRDNTKNISTNTLEELIVPAEGITLPVVWGDLGVKMVGAGVIDPKKFEFIYKNQNINTNELKKLLYGYDNGKIKITRENSGIILNLLWALGLGTNNDILEKGPMADPRYGGIENFASVGGWTIANGTALEHYSRHTFIVLTDAQQELTARVSKKIYRPCCDNPTYFPDCNHGVAMLGLLELMASQGVSENEMYRVALQINSYWFPGTYLTIAKYLALKGIPWEKADPKEILGQKYSSASGYRSILSQIVPAAGQGGGGCGI